MYMKAYLFKVKGVSCVFFYADFSTNTQEFGTISTQMETLISVEMKISTHKFSICVRNLGLRARIV